MDEIFKSQKGVKKYNVNRFTACLLAVFMLFSALSAGSITVHAEATDGNVARIGDVYYTSWDAAIDAATDKDTIMLLDNIDLGEETSIAPGKDITIDLNGYSLKAAAFNAFEKTEVIDTSEGKTGVLKVTNFIPAATNSQMPVYNGTDGYVFATMEEQVHRSSEMGEDTFKLIFKPYFGTEAMNGLLANGGNAAQVSIWIRLEWTDATGKPQSKELKYTDDMVKAVYGGTGQAFYIEASGVDQFDDLTITPLVKSNMGAYPEWSDSKFDCGGEENNLIDNDYNKDAWTYEVKYTAPEMGDLPTKKNGGAYATVELLKTDGYSSEDGCLFYDITNSGTRTNNFQIKYELSGENIIEKDKTYKVGFRAKLVEKTASDVEQKIKVNVCKLRHVSDNNTEYSEEITFDISEGNGEWTLYEYYLTANSTQSSATLLYQIGGDSVENVYLYLDDFFLTEVDERGADYSKEVAIKTTGVADASEVIVSGDGVHAYANENVDFYAASVPNSGLIFDSWIDEYGNKVSANSYFECALKKSAEYTANFKEYSYTDKNLSAPVGETFALTVSEPVLSSSKATATANVVAPEGWTIAETGVIFYPGYWTENFNIFSQDIQKVSADSLSAGAFSVTADVETKYGVLVKAYAIAKNTDGEMVVQYSDSAYTEPSNAPTKAEYKTVTYYEALGLFSQEKTHSTELNKKVITERVATTNCDMLSFTPTCYKMNAWVSNVPGMFDYNNPAENTVGVNMYDRCVSYIQAGGDPVKDIIDACKEANIAVFLDYRMNDGHNADNLEYPTHTPFFKNNPQYWRIQEPRKRERTFNYLCPDVQDHYYAILAELLEKYPEIDGINMDFMRDPYYFPDGDEERGTVVMTEFVGRVRELVNKYSIERGKDIQLAVRVPEEVNAADDVGLDVETWDECKYVDIVYASTYYFNAFIDIEGYDDIIDNAKLLGIVHYATKQDTNDTSKRRYITKEEAYASAKSVLDRGADGIFWWNMQYSKDKEGFYSQLGAVSARDGSTLQEDLQALDKNYVLPELDMSPTAGREQNKKIYINENMENYHTSLMRVEATGTFTNDTQIEVYFNDIKLEEKTDRNSAELFEPRDNNVAYPERDAVKFFIVPLEAFKQGWNDIKIKNISGYETCSYMCSIGIALYTGEPNDTKPPIDVFSDVELQGNNLPEGGNKLKLSVKSGEDNDEKKFPVVPSRGTKTDANTGESCIYFEVTDAGTNVINALQVATNDDNSTGFAIEPGTYKFGFKAKLLDTEEYAEGTTNKNKTLAVNVCRLHQYDTYKNKYAEDLAFTITENDGAWTDYEGTFIVSEAHTDTRLQVQMGGDRTQNVNLYMADFYLIKNEDGAGDAGNEGNQGGAGNEGSEGNQGGTGNEGGTGAIELTGDKFQASDVTTRLYATRKDDADVSATANDGAKGYNYYLSDSASENPIHFTITSITKDEEACPNALQVYGASAEAFAITPGMYTVGFKAKLKDTEDYTEGASDIAKKLKAAVRLHKKGNANACYSENDAIFEIAESGDGWYVYEGTLEVSADEVQDAILRINIGGAIAKAELYMADFCLYKVE